MKNPGEIRNAAMARRAPGIGCCKTKQRTAAIRPEIKMPRIKKPEEGFKRCSFFIFL
jgi:hypothetical protein